MLWGGLSGFGGGGPGPGPAVPARVGFEGVGAEGFEPGEQFVQPPVVVDPGRVVAVRLSASRTKVLKAPIFDIGAMAL